MAGLEELCDFTGVKDDTGDAEVSADDATEEDVNDDGTTDIDGGAGSGTADPKTAIFLPPS